MDQIPKELRIPRRKVFPVLGIWALGLAACSNIPGEPEPLTKPEAEGPKLSKAGQQVNKICNELLAKPEELKRLTEEVKEANPEIYDRWVKIKLKRPGTSSADMIEIYSGGVIFEQTDGFMVILTARHPFTSDTMLYPMHISQPQVAGGLEKSFGNFDPLLEHYTVVSGHGDLAALVIKTDDPKQFAALPVADFQPGETVYSIGLPEGNMLTPLFLNKIQVPEIIERKDEGTLLPLPGFAFQSSGDPVYNGDLKGVVYREADVPDKVVITTILDNIEILNKGIEEAKKILNQE